MVEDSKCRNRVNGILRRRNNRRLIFVWLWKTLGKTKDLEVFFEENPLYWKERSFEFGIYLKFGRRKSRTKERLCHLRSPLVRTVFHLRPKGICHWEIYVVCFVALPVLATSCPNWRSCLPNPPIAYYPTIRDPGKFFEWVSVDLGVVKRCTTHQIFVLYVQLTNLKITALRTILDWFRTGLLVPVELGEDVDDFTAFLIQKGEKNLVANSAIPTKDFCMCSWKT